MPIIWMPPGNMFSQPADARVNAVNAVGVMGKGLAAEFKRRYPAMFAEYRSVCAQRYLQPGALLVWHHADGTIYNCCTKDHYRDPSRYEWVGRCLENLRFHVEQEPVRSLTVPALGCGLGGLDWRRVRRLVVDALGGWPGDCYVYEPG